MILDPHNRRLKVLDADPDLVRHLLPFLDQLVADRGDGTFTKLTVYGRGGGASVWADLGLRIEATIRGFYADASDAVLAVRYTDPTRAVDPEAARHDAIVEAARLRGSKSRSLDAGLRLRRAEEGEAQRLVHLLRATFDDYPTALEESTLRRALSEDRTRIHVVEDEAGALLAMASAEIDRSRINAEITDCVTLPAARGRGLMGTLIRSFESPLREEGIVDLYTIARAGIAGMNHAFAGCGYAYTGRLIQNCRMPQGFESMNVWCRRTSAS